MCPWTPTFSPILWSSTPVVRKDEGGRDHQEDHRSDTRKRGIVTDLRTHRLHTRSPFLSTPLTHRRHPVYCGCNTHKHPVDSARTISHTSPIPHPLVLEHPVQPRTPRSEASGTHTDHCTRTQRPDLTSGPTRRETGLFLTPSCPRTPRLGTRGSSRGEGGVLM